MTDISRTTQVCTPRQAKKFIIRIFMAGLVPFIKGSPGVGKSSIVHQIGHEYRLKVLDTSLATCTPEDMNGLPKITDDVAKFIPFENFPTEETPIPEGYDGWIIFLDEFNSAGKAVMSAAYKLVLNKMVGLKKLHPNVKIVCAGNLDTDRAFTHNIGTALQSRFINLRMTINFKEFMEDVAYKNNWDQRITAYLNYKPTHLHDFSPDHNEETFCCPRTWEFMNKLIIDQDYKLIENADGQTVYEMDDEAAMFAGTITSGVALEFIQFTKVFHNLPKIADIIAMPSTMNIPVDPPLMFATVSHLLEHIDEKNFEDIAVYINRFRSEFRITFFRGLLQKKPNLKQHPAFRSAVLELSRYLND